MNTKVISKPVVHTPPEYFHKKRVLAVSAQYVLVTFLTAWLSVESSDLDWSTGAVESRTGLCVYI